MYVCLLRAPEYVQIVDTTAASDTVITRFDAIAADAFRVPNTRQCTNINSGSIGVLIQLVCRVIITQSGRVVADTKLGSLFAEAF